MKEYCAKIIYTLSVTWGEEDKDQYLNPEQKAFQEFLDRFAEGEADPEIELEEEEGWSNDKDVENSLQTLYPDLVEGI